MSFDPQECIRLLQDKAVDEGIREDAADSLMHHPKQESVEALFGLLMNEEEGKDFRLELAGCLGSIWSEIGIEEEKMNQIDGEFRDELLREYNLKMNT